MSFLNEKTFCYILLPWIQVMVSGTISNKVLGLQMLTALVDCMVGLMNELTGSQRAEAAKIYQELEERFC